MLRRFYYSSQLCIGFQTYRIRQVEGGVGGDVGHPLPTKVGDPPVGIFISHSSSLPLDTRGGVGPPTPLGVGGPFEGIIMCHPPPRRGMTEAW